MKLLFVAIAALLMTGTLIPLQAEAFTVDGSCSTVDSNVGIQVKWKKLPADHKSTSNPNSIIAGGDVPGNYQVFVSKSDKVIHSDYTDPTPLLRTMMIGKFVMYSMDTNIGIKLDTSKKGYQVTTGNIRFKRSGTEYKYDLDCGVKVLE